MNNNSQQYQLQSSTFEVSRETTIGPNQFITNVRQLEIIKPGQPHKVIFGPMKQQKKSIFQILTPYMNNIANITGNMVSKLYQYSKYTSGWIYKKFTNQVIPYTAQQIPKLIFIITKKKQQSTIINIQQSGQFCVLDFEQKKQQSQQINKNIKKNNRSIIIIQVDNNDQSEEKKKEIQDMKRILKENNTFQFNIGQSQDIQGQAYFMETQDAKSVYQNKVEENKQLKELKQIQKKQQQFYIPSSQDHTVQFQQLNSKYQNNNQLPKHNDKLIQQHQKQIMQQKQKQQANTTNIILDEYPDLQQPQYTNKLYLSNNKKPLKKHLYFYLQNDNSQNYNVILSRMENNENIQSGYLAKTEDFLKNQSKISNSDSSNNSDYNQQNINGNKNQQINKKVVDNTRNIRVQIDENRLNNKKQIIQKKQLLDKQKMLLIN